MSEIMVRERFLRSGKKVYEYSFEMASVDGKRKRKSKSGFASKRDARIAGRKALSEYENVGQVMVDRDISYADFLDLWMENDCKLTCKESTLYGYEKKIRLYLKPELGGYRVSSIDKKILQTFITDLYNDGFSINTIISIKGLLTKSFNYALENHYIMISPANRLVIPQNMQPDKPTRRKEHIYLTKDNIDSLFERFPKGTSSFVPLQIAYHTGMRQSSPNLCVNSSFSYVVLSTLLLSSRDLTEWSLVYHNTLSYQRFYDLHSIHYDHLEGLHQLI